MRLKKVRELAGLSQSQLVKQTGISKQALKGYEQGVRSLDKAGFFIILRLCVVLECRASDILEDGEVRTLCMQYEQMVSTVGACAGEEENENLK